MISPLPSYLYRVQRRSAIAAGALAWAVLAVASLSGATVTVKDQNILVDGRPTKLWGIRVASASQTPALTEQLLANLDDYRAHGVNAIAVYYMGSLGAYADPFSADGRTIDPAHQARMDAIIRACDARGMIAVVGVFYQRGERPNLKDWSAAQTAVRTAAAALRPHRNVIFNIANEQNSEVYESLPWRQVRSPESILALCGEVKRVDPQRVVGGGGYHHPSNEIIGRAPEVDVLLFDTKFESSAALHRRFGAAGVHKPMINVEIFGGWTKQFQPPGVYPDAAKREHFREIEEGLATDGLHIFFHSSPWLQGTAEPRAAIHFELGGQGTASDPGIRWYFERLKASARGGPARVTATSDIRELLSEPTNATFGADQSQRSAKAGMRPLFAEPRVKIGP